MRARRLTLAIASILAIVLSVPVSAATSICQMVRTKASLLEFSDDTEPDELGEVRIEADFDGDGIQDVLVWFRTGSASRIPADLSSATLTLSSKGRSYAVQGHRVLVLRYSDRSYVIVSNLLPEKGRSKQTVYSVGPRRIAKLCSHGGRGIE